MNDGPGSRVGVYMSCRGIGLHPAGKFEALTLLLTLSNTLRKGSPSNAAVLLMLTLLLKL